MLPNKIFSLPAAFLIIATLATACSPAATPPPVSTPAPSETVTETLPPPPTETTVPSPIPTDIPTLTPLPSETPTAALPQPLSLTSDAFSEGEEIPEEYTFNFGKQCSGKNISPPLSWVGVPAGTQSLAVLMTDPDADNWVHWVQFNIPPDTAMLTATAGGPPVGIKGKNDFGELGYGGPCPPFGTHNYVFTLYALDVVLPLTEGATLKQVVAAMEGHILDQAQLTGQRTAKR